MPIGVVVLRLGKNISAEVVGIVPCLARRRVVLPDELVQAVVGVGRCAVA